MTSNGNRELIERLRTASTHVDAVLIIVGLHEERTNGGTASRYDIEQAFKAARRHPPKNLPATLDHMRGRNLLFRSGTGYLVGARGMERARRADRTDQLEQEWDQSVSAISASLEDLVRRIPDADEQGYMREAIACLAVKAPRAAVVMGWTGAMYHLRLRAIGAGLPRFDAAFRTVFPSSKKKVPARDQDLEDFSDRELVMTAEKMSLVSPAGKKAVLAQLDLRNSCGHPTAAVPGINVAKAFFEQVLQHVFR